MRPALVRIASAALMLAPLAACSSDSSSGADAGEQTPDANYDSLSELVGAEVEVLPGTEPYWCVRKTLTEDRYITRIEDLSPLGTHHTVLSVTDVDDPSGPDGLYPCSVSDNEMQMLFASGVGSDSFSFPDGVGIKLSAGQQVKLNLHLYNAGSETLSGHAGTLVQLVPPDQAADLELAEMIFAGNVVFTLESTSGPQTAEGDCAMRDGTLINLWPHMHKLGIHMKVELDDTILFDDDYDFEEQKNWPMTVPLSAGQRMNVTCTFVNDTGHAVRWGESSDEEMCFAGFYRYPAIGAGNVCAGSGIPGF